MRLARDHACRFTSISSRYACPGNDGGEHEDVCDLLTKAIEARDDEHSVEYQRLSAECRRLDALLNTPEILDFVKAVQLEAAHQRARWGSDHDAGKTDADWFWLIGYLGGKALRNPGPYNPPGHRQQQRDKQLHRIVTVAAAAANWHASKLGATDMRPGIDTPTGEPT